MNTEAQARPGAPLAWARVLGCGAIQLDYGHGVAVNGGGRVLVAARFDAPEGGAAIDVDGGELVQLDTDGARRWRIVLTGAAHLRAPAVALDDQGAAYVAGPYEPSQRGPLDGSARVCLTQLDAEGRPIWSEPIARMAVVQGLPVQPPIGVAADPHGGACVAWTESGAIRVVRFGATGAQLWERRFPFRGSVDPRVTIALDATGAATVWGAFCGALRFEGGDGPALHSQGWDRFLARVQLDGSARWSQVLRAAHTDDYAAAVHRDGAITLAAVVKPRAGEERDPAARDLSMARLDATGSTTQRTRFAGEPHACARVLVASTGAEGIALAGYFSGSFAIAGQEVRSRMAASESVLVARVGGARGSWARALHGPELQAGLSIHGDASGAVVLAGWCAAGTMDLGGERIEAGERAAFYVVRYGA